MSFQPNDMANIVRQDGTEATVRVIGLTSNNDQYIVSELGQNASYAGEPQFVSRDHLLRPKGRFFDVRGLVFTISTIHPGEEGEIVSIGHGPDNQIFYRVKFADGKTEWFSKEGIIIEDQESSSMKIWEALGR